MVLNLTRYTKGSFDDVDDGLDGVDIGDDLSDSLHGVGAVSEKENGGLLSRGGSTKR